MSESVEREEGGVAPKSSLSEQHDSCNSMKSDQSMGVPIVFKDGHHSADKRDHQKKDLNDQSDQEHQTDLVLRMDLEMDLERSERVNRKLEEDLKRSQEDLKRSQESIMDLENEIKKKDFEISQLLDKIEDEKSSSFLQKKVKEQQARIKELEGEMEVKVEEQRDDLYRGEEEEEKEEEEEEEGEEEEVKVEKEEEVGEDTAVHMDMNTQGVGLASPPSSLTSLCPVGLGMSTTPCGRCNTCVKVKESNQMKTPSYTNQEPAKPDEEKTANRKQEPAKPFLTITQILTVLAVILAIILASALYPFSTESGHKLHQFGPLMKEYEEKIAELVKTEAAVQQKIQERQVKIQEIKHSVELNRKDADTVIATDMQVFTALISCIDRSRAEFMDGIEEEQKTTEKQAEGFINELQKDIAQLEERISDLQQLSRTEDRLQQHILFVNFRSINTLPPTKDWTKVNVHQPSYVWTVWTAVAQLEKTLSEEMEKLRDAELRRIQQYQVDVTLDSDTANPWLILSEDGKQVSDGDTRNDVPDNKERFSDYVFVLGKQSFSSGRFYYEVQVKGKTCWCLGVARESINRKGSITVNPNNGYWTILLNLDGEYEAFTDPPVLLPVRDKLQKVGVFVDYEEGLVSFYDVETRVHLYSFTGLTFTEKLFPLFYPGFKDGDKNSAPLIISPVSMA